MSSPITIKLEHLQVDSSKRLSGTITVTFNSLSGPAAKKGEPLAITLIPMRVVEYLADSGPTMTAHKTDTNGMVSINQFQLPWGDLVDGLRVLVRCFTVKKHPATKYVSMT